MKNCCALFAFCWYFAHTNFITNYFNWFLTFNNATANGWRMKAKEINQTKEKKNKLNNKPLCKCCFSWWPLQKQKKRKIYRNVLFATFYFIRFNKNILPVCNSLWFMESKGNKFDCANITCKRCLQFGSIVMLFCWHCMCWIRKRYCWNRINQKMNIKKNENSAIRLTISVL